MDPERDGNLADFKHYRMTNRGRRMDTNNREHLHDDVFGQSFALYDHAAMEEFVGFFRQRFEANNLDAKSIFGGKRCLDAGCGNGRGSLFMLSNGAASVDTLDISQTNIDSTTHNIEDFGFKNFKCHLGSLEDIPFPDETFDFVWCNGVVMHTHNPDKCLQELARVLKVGGKAWIYVYGSGGLYWYCVKRFRALVRDIAPHICIATLRLLGYSPRYVAEYLDDWKVPYLRTYTDEDFGGRMESLGFAKGRPLPYGVSYDTSHRKSIFPADVNWLGEGDLRYMAVKERRGDPTSGRAISDSEYGSDYTYAASIIDRFGKLFDDLGSQLVLAGGGAADPTMTIAACARIQMTLRNLMTENRAFPVNDVAQCIEETSAMVAGIGRK